MAAPSEIEKLERRYAENPDGRFFAPLADAYRKTGNLVRALELVRAGLVKHPEYLSAYIVLGRCLLDKGDDVEAEKTFRSVLELDAENIIALKSLAEICERTNRVVEARQWLQKLLVVDSMNTEAEADLQRLGGAIAEETTQPIEAVRGETVATAAEVSFADVAREVDPLAALAELPEAPSARASEPEVAAAAAPQAVAASAAPPVVAQLAPVPPLFPPPPPPPAFLERTTAPLLEQAAEARPSAPSGAPEPVVEAEGAPAPYEVPPPTPDRHPLPQELQVTDAGLELMPFDDSLAWGTGERSSRAIRAEDVAVAHDESLTTPAGEFQAEIEQAAGASAPAGPAAGKVAGFEPPSPAVEGADFAVERQDEQPFFGADAQPQPVPNVELPADLSGAYSITDLPESTGAAAYAPRGTPTPPSGLPLILPEDVTPAEELARPSSKLVQMVSPAPPREDRSGQAEQPMLTETLGDLYLSQGFRSEAADVYRRLLGQRQNDEGLRAKLRALEAPPADLSATRLGAESVGTWLRRIASARLGEAAASAPAEPPPGPSPLEAAFAAPSAETIGEPAHPAEDAFSLDQIFGQSAEPAPPPAPPAPAPVPSPGASFDEFFGAPPEAGSVRPVAKEPEAPAQSGDEDLSAFNAWLQGLKR